MRVLFYYIYTDLNRFELLFKTVGGFLICGKEMSGYHARKKPGQHISQICTIQKKLLKTAKNAFQIAVLLRFITLCINIFT